MHNFVHMQSPALVCAHSQAWRLIPILWLQLLTSRQMAHTGHRPMCHTVLCLTHHPIARRILVRRVWLDASAAARSFVHEPVWHTRNAATCDKSAAIAIPSEPLPTSAPPSTIQDRCPRFLLEEFECVRNHALRRGGEPHGGEHQQQRAA